MTDHIQDIATPEYFIEEYHRFRHMFGDARYSLEQLDRAFGALALLYLNLDDGTEKGKAAMDAFISLAEVEWPMRRLYMEFGL